MDNEAARLGLTTADAAGGAERARHAALPRPPGHSSTSATFLQAISTAGYTEDEFLDEMRQDMTRDQLTQAVEGNFAVPPNYAQALFLFINERRAADYVIVSPDAAGAVAPPSDAVLTRLCEGQSRPLLHPGISRRRLCHASRPPM